MHTSLFRIKYSGNKIDVLIEQQCVHYASFKFIKKWDAISNWAVGKYLYRSVQ
jgi:hypothetical protein